MTARPGWPASSGLATFQDIRRAFAGLVIRDTSGAVRRGVFRTTDTALITGKASMAVDVAAFVVALDRNGLVIVANDGVVSVTISNAPASGTRWSVIYVKQRESDPPFSDGADGPVIDKVESTTSLVAARALIPSGGLELGYVQVAAGVVTTTAAVIANTVPYTAAIGGTIPFRTKSEMDAVTNMPDGTAGITNDKLVRFTSKGGVWNGALGPVTTPTYNAAVWAAHANGLQFFIKQDGMIGVEGGFQNFGAGTFNAGLAGSAVGTIPAALRPSRTIILPASMLLPGGITQMGHASLLIQNDGQMFVSLSSTNSYAAGGLQVFLGGNDYRPA